MYANKQSENNLPFPTDKVEYVNEFEVTYNKDKEEVTIAVGPHDQIPTGSIYNYPEGSVLLDTRLRYGEVSEDVSDVVQRKKGWQVPEGYRDHLRGKHVADPNLGIKFVVHRNELTTVVIRNWFRPFWGGCCTVL